MRLPAHRERKCDVSRSNACRRKLPYRDCDVIVSRSEDPSSTTAVTCIDAETGTFVGTARVPDQVDRPITDEEVARMIGGAYRLASIAVDLEMDLLVRRARRVSDKLRLRRRLWRRRHRPAIRGDKLQDTGDAGSQPPRCSL
ncbi:hypothetical protein XH98_36650 [Bradyrhizobium sp. CCBAU 51745]|nr:hypothetical protein [Bradyrhizobium sp. CCBAU 45384]MDA9444511.1 hypothetical protein [Bradyrhizobium sp. CCBAU 51745]